MRIKNISVGKGRLSVVLWMPPFERYTTPELINQVLQDFPRLPDHTCINSVGPHFSDVMNHTSQAHLIEHMTIDLQVQADAEHPERLFVGNTQWIDESAGLARVQVNFFDDLVALRALNQAVDYLNRMH